MAITLLMQDFCPKSALKWRMLSYESNGMMLSDFGMSGQRVL